MSEVKALKEEIAELRKQITALAVAMAELASRQPYSWCQPVVWNQQPVVKPWVTYPTTINGSNGETTLTNS